MDTKKATWPCKGRPLALLAALAALALALAAPLGAPAQAWADETAEQGGAVATVSIDGGEAAECTSLKDAFKAVADKAGNQNVTAVKAIITVKEPASLDEGISVSYASYKYWNKEVDIELDLNGNTIMYAGSGDYAIKVERERGKGSGSLKLTVKGTGGITVSGATSAIRVNGADLAITGGTFKNEGTGEGSFAIHAQDPESLTIAPAAGTPVTVEGNGAVAFNSLSASGSGSAAISGGAFKSNGSTAALFVYKDAKDCDVSITGGEFTGGESGGSPAVAFGGAATNNNDTTIDISGSTFTGSVSEYSTDTTAENSRITLSGGTYSVEPKGVAYAEGCEYDSITGKVVEQAQEDYVAQIVDGGSYATVQEAIDATTAGQTVKLLANVTESVTVAEGKSITLDLNGKTLTGVTDGNGRMADVVTNNGTLIITDNSSDGTGTIMGGSDTGQEGNAGRGGIALVNNGTCTIKGGTVKRGDNGTFGNYTVRNNATMSIEGGTVTNNSNKSSLVINGYSDTGTAGTMTISGGTLQQDSMTALKNDTGTLAIKDNAHVVSANNQALQNWATASMEGGTLEGNVWVFTLSSKDDNGEQVDTSATLNVTGGSISAKTIYAWAYYNSDDSLEAANAPAINISDSANVTIAEGGNMGPVYGTSAGNSFTNDKTKASFNVSGGTFNVVVPENCCAEGFIPSSEKDENDKYTVTEGTYYARILDGAGNVVESYTSLDEAIAAVQPGQTVKLLKSVELLGNTAVKIDNKGTAEKPITLDFAGYTISGNNSSTVYNSTDSAPGGILAARGSYLTLTDTSSTGTKGGIVNTITAKKAASALYCAPTKDNLGAVTLNGGVRIEIATGEGTATRGICFQNSVNKGTGFSLTINDAAIKSSGNTLHEAVTPTYPGLVTINGGSFVSNKPFDNTAFSGISNGGAVINGGTFANWATGMTGYVSSGHSICASESDSAYAFTVKSAAPKSYVAVVQGDDIYVENGSLYALNVATNLNGKTVNVIANATYSFPEGRAFGLTSGEPYALTLNLADNVILYGGMNLQLADVTVAGNGVLADKFAWTPLDKFEMIETSQANVHSCRYKSEEVAAQITTKDGRVMQYATVRAALTPARSNPGCTVTLFKDETLTSGISYGVVNNVVPDITLDLNGHTLTYTGNAQMFEVKKGASLSVVDNGEGETKGSLVATSANAVLSISDAISDGKQTSKIKIGTGVTVKGSVFVQGDSGTLDVYGTVDTTGLNDFAISGNGSGTRNSTINIHEGAVVKGDYTAIYHPQSGTLSVSGGTIEGKQGIQMCSGTLNVTGNPTITAMGANNPSGAGNDGDIPDGAAISVVDRGYPGGAPVVNISGSPTVMSASGVDAVQAYTWNADDKTQDSWDAAADNVGISGGTFSNDVTEYCTGDKIAELQQDETGNWVVVDFTLGVSSDGEKAVPASIVSGRGEGTMVVKVSSEKIGGYSATAYPTTSLKFIDANGAESGYVFAGWYSNEGATEACVSVPEGSDAYAKFVDARVLSVKAQITANTKASSEKADMRFVTTVDGVKYQKVGFSIVFGGKTKTVESGTVYEKIVAKEGGVEFAYQPTEFAPASKYFMTYTITDIPNSAFGEVFSVTPYWRTPDGTTVCGATSQLKVSDGIKQN